MGNNKSIASTSTARCSLPTNSSNSTKSKSTKSNSLNSLLNSKHIPLRAKFNLVKIKSKNSNKPTQVAYLPRDDLSEYTNINEYNSTSFQQAPLDNYFSIDDDKLASTVSQPTLASQEVKFDSNLYSKVDFVSKNRHFLSTSNKKQTNLLNTYQTHLQPIAKIITKLARHDFRRNKAKSMPRKSFDPNEEFFLSNEKLPPSIQPPPVPLNTYEPDDNYHSVQDQYDYISSSTASSSAKFDSKEETFANGLLCPPPLPPASTQPSRNQVISQIYTTIEPLSINNQVYYSFTSDNGSTSSMASSTNSSYLGKNRQSLVDGDANNLSILLTCSSSVSTRSNSLSSSSNPKLSMSIRNDGSDFKTNNLNSTDMIVQI